MPKAKSRKKKSSHSELKETPTQGSSRLVSVSLFSGGGGLDIGVEDAGFKNLVSVEWDANAVETLRYNAVRKGSVTRVLHADIRTVDPLEIAQPGIDLLHGGPPCQAFSLIGKRDSLDDYRGLLLFEMIRFAKAIQPKALLLEQVKGLLSAPDERGEQGGVFRRFTRELGELGYTVKWSVLCAADYGVPQLRERVFIVALRGPNGFYFPPPTNAAVPEETPLFKIKPYVGSGTVLDDLPPPVPKGHEATFPNHVDVTPDRDRERIHPVPEGSHLACQLHVPLSIRRNLSKKDTTKYRRLDRNEPSLTLRCGEIFFHPTEDRYLTPRECMRLHGYPDEHILCGPIRGRCGVARNLDQHRQVANSVPPPLGRVVAKQIAKVLLNERKNI